MISYKLEINFFRDKKMIIFSDSDEKGWSDYYSHKSLTQSEGQETF
jgi:hypothetical protein